MLLYPSLRLLQHLIGHDNALIDLGNLGIPHHSLHRVFPNITIPSKDLNRVGGHFHGGVGGNPFGHRGKLGNVGGIGVLMEKGCDLVHHIPGRFHTQGHLR